MSHAALEQIKEKLTRVRAELTVIADAQFKHGERVTSALDRVADDAAALAFHLQPQAGGALHVVLLGGTGAGKSTLVNKLAATPERPVTATSFRRTFTSGCVAVAPDDTAVAKAWLGVPHKTADAASGPPRGVADMLTIVVDSRVPGEVVLVDTPDLDGDLPEHHRQADRAFRWAQAVVLVATPEKYQLPEIGAYSNLARRYGVPRIFVLNKADDLDAPRDWAEQLVASGEAEPDVRIVPRDGSPTVPDAAKTLPNISELVDLLRRDDSFEAGLTLRASDLAGRLQDQVLAPLQRRRHTIDVAKRRIAALTSPETDVNVNGVTRQLQRRLQQQSVLYLMGPQRIFDRLRSVPNLVARLPRNAWDLVVGSKSAGGDDEPPTDVSTQSGVPDFPAELVDSFRLLQSRMIDVLHELDLSGDDWKLDATRAGNIATEELAELQRWLEQRWNSKPRDTRLIEKMVKYIPGSQHLTKISEAAPYLLTAVCAATSATIGHIDQVVIGGYLLTTWLGERLSNEVTGRTREANRRINERFSELSQEQTKQLMSWLEAQVPTAGQLATLEREIIGLAEVRP